MDVLTQVIDYALAKPGMYVILNAHHEETIKAGNQASVLATLWTELSMLCGEMTVAGLASGVMTLTPGSTTCTTVPTTLVWGTSMGASTTVVKRHFDEASSG